MKYSFKNNEKVEYVINWAKPPKGCYGICDSPEMESPKIKIDPALTKQKTINIHSLRKQGLSLEDVESVLTRTFNELDAVIRDVDFVVDISAVANMVQPETDKLLGKL